MTDQAVLQRLDIDPVSLQRAGWVLVRTDHVAAAAVRFGNPDGRFEMIETVTYGVGSHVQTTIAQAIAFAAHPANLRRLLASIEDRDRLDARALEQIDTWERGAPQRIARWGLGPEAEAAQDRILALGDIPEVGNSDESLRLLAEMYPRVSETSSTPAKVIAEANDIPVEKVRAMLKEARRRGLLTPGRTS